MLDKSLITIEIENGNQNNQGTSMVRNKGTSLLLCSSIHHIQSRWFEFELNNKVSSPLNVNTEKLKL